MFLKPMNNKKPLIRLAILLIFTFIWFGTAEKALAQTNVSGSIGTNTTWVSAGSPYILNSTVTINPGVMLKLEPGTVVKGNGGRLLVDWAMLAQGTASKP